MVDIYTTWDSVRNQFAFAAIGQYASDVWYGCATCGSGGTWGTTNSPAMQSDPANGIDWDYPSIGIDANGRIIIGAVRFSSIGVDGFWVTFLDYGSSTWSSPVRIGTTPGHKSRVVATSNLFEAFIQISDPKLNPMGIDRWESSNGTNWTFAGNIASFSAPLNRSPQNYTSTATAGCPDPNQPCNCADSGCNPSSNPCRTIGYSPAIDAKGSTNGLWIVGVPINVKFDPNDVIGYNNVYVCTSDRGCGVVNSAPDDEFMSGVSVSGDSGYWVSYLTYSTLQTRNLPLIQQNIYFPPGQAPIGATTYSNIDPRIWPVNCPNSICGISSCFLIGDYNGMSSNPYASSSSQFVRKVGTDSELRQVFSIDPPQKPNVENFKPNFIPYPVGANLTPLGLPLTPDTSAIGATKHIFLIFNTR